jgi:energy-coupling factor transporter ATP-binding protein EcfA2
MSQVFDRLQISGYRALQLVNLSQLGQVNVIVGDNNAGKTSILEAVSLLCNPLDPFQWLEVSQRRLYLGRASLMRLRPNTIEALKWIFYQKIGSTNDEFYQNEIQIEANGSAALHELRANLGELYGSALETNTQKSFEEEDISSPEEDASSPENGAVLAGLELDIRVNLAPEKISSDPLSLSPSEPKSEKFEFWENERLVQRRRNKPIVKNATIFPSYSSSEPLGERLSRIILQEDGKNKVVELLRSFDDNILDIHILTPTPTPTIYIEHKELGFAPLSVFGDGFKRTLIIALTVLTTDNGVLLIDEIETSLHFSALGSVFSWLIETCRRREIQLFVTTHSLEAIDAMLQPEIATEDVVAFRLNHTGQAPQRFSGNLLHRLRSERGLDVR